MRQIRTLLALALMLVATSGLTGYDDAEAGPQTRIFLPVVYGRPANGQQPDQLFPFPAELVEQAVQASGRAAYASFVTVTDDSEAITVEVPSEWREIETGVWRRQGEPVGVFIAASGNLDAFNDTRSEAGVFLGVSRALAQAHVEEAFLASEQHGVSDGCNFRGRLDYEDPFYTGQYDYYMNCVEGDHNLLVVATMPANQEFLIVLRMVVVSGADLEAATRILETFQVIGDPEVDDHHDG